MAKRKDITPPANDYLDQLQWQSRHRRGLWPVRYEPTWKYKIVRRYGVSLRLDRLAGAISVISLSIAMVDLFSSGGRTTGAKIFLGVVIALILTVLFFAIRDVSKGNDQNAEETDHE